jgi:hypothetical protein
MTTPPEIGFERLLAALGRDLLEAPDEEILDVANELGHRSDMKASTALLGVTFTLSVQRRHKPSAQQGQDSGGTSTMCRSGPGRKGDVPS